MRSMKPHPIILIFAAVVLCAGAAHAYDDGFSASGKIEGKYTVTYYSPEADIIELIQKINMRPSDKILAGGPLGPGASPKEELGQSLDALFLQVSDILDMHLYSLKINIKICRDNERLKDIYYAMFNAHLGDRQSFYVFTGNTIYTSEENFKRGVVGHEISHAIICHYFAVPAPIKVQEVLSMYVEYNLRSTGNN